MSIGHLISIHILRSTAESILGVLQSGESFEELSSFDINELSSALEDAIAEDGEEG